jgi:hypothetical protein
MVVFSIKGDYFDCQLYAGNLFLWTYMGVLKVYNFNKILSYFRCGDKVISEYTLNNFLVGRVERMEVRFPTDSEVYDGKYYLTGRSGLFQSRLDELESGFKKVWDCPLFSISAQKKKGLTMAGGNEGVFIYSETDAIRKKYGMINKKIVQASNCHANHSAFCKQGLYVTSILDNSFYLRLFNVYKDNLTIPIEKIFPSERVSLSWSYRDKVYAYIDEKIKIKRIELINNEIKFVDENEYWFYPQKGKVLTGTTTSFADIIELENALVIFPKNRVEESCAETIWEPVTRWRTFPKSIGYNNIIMVILEEELRLYILDEYDEVNSSNLNLISKLNGSR